MSALQWNKSLCKKPLGWTLSPLDTSLRLDTPLTFARERVRLGAGSRVLRRNESALRTDPIFVFACGENSTMRGAVLVSNKLQRINEDIQRVLSTHLRNIKDPRVKQGMISVTRADTTSDLRHCKVYLSVFGLESEKEFMKGLKSASGFLRHELGQSLNLRYTPELSFELDKSIEHGAKITSILNDLDIKEDDEDEQEVE